MNLYKLHSNPEELIGDETIVPSVQYRRLSQLVKQRKAPGLMNKMKNRLINTDKEIKQIMDRLKNDPWAAGMIARHILDKPWPEGEPAIAKHPYLALLYARDILAGPFPAGEPAIASERSYAFDYANEVLRGRFPEGEPEIRKSKGLWKKYTTNVV